MLGFGGVNNPIGSLNVRWIPYYIGYVFSTILTYLRVLHTDKSDVENKAVNKLLERAPNDNDKVDIEQKKAPSASKEGWLLYHDLEINPELFRRGLVVLRTSMIDPQKKLDSGQLHFTLGTRELYLEKTAKSLDVKKKITLFDQLEKFCGGGSAPTHGSECTVYNKARRDEKFSSLVVGFQDSQVGYYVYPWLSSNNQKIEFKGFKKIHTAGCIYGPWIMGKDQNNNSIPLIKHDIKFFEGQQIVNIEVDLKTFSPYEKMLFSELEKLALLIKSLTEKDQTAQLHYHLPYYDYILYGVELFLRKKISLTALDTFFKAILLRKLQHESEISRICKAHDITVKIESPFENLFGVFSEIDIEESGHTKFILDKLELDKNDDEAQLVARCLLKLKANTNHKQHREIWAQLLDTDQAQPTKLEELFKIANAFMIACTSFGNEDYETCSLLPLTEKQVQVSYSVSNKKIRKPFPAVINLTTLDPLIGYDSTNSNKGLLFYFNNNSLQNINKLIEKRRILDLAHSNIAHQVADEDVVDLTTALKKHKVKLI